MKRQDEHWMSISDVMSGLMIVFMFIAVAFMMQVQNEQRQKNDMIYNYAVIKHKIYSALFDEFKDDLQTWDAEIDEKTLTLRFKEPDVLFGVGSDILTPKFQAILNDFLPRYISVISQDEYKDYIEEIRIEGHTDPFWAGAATRQQEYLNNMELSQSRTRAVLVYAINMPALQGNLEWIIRRITANGLSSSQPVTLDGKIDAKLSRRVDFRIRTKADEKMNELAEGMTYSGND
ncbi:MAG: OmpA family protein [Selenomonadaceae bacterium]|nr:OmpA family protein [Selenomonadaceae bacterium]